jgi:glycosyltransferase involved in cell wall biosynthesis
MRIAIIADDIVKEGGTKEVIKHMRRALVDDNDNQLSIEYVNSEKYFPRYLPTKWKDLFRIFYLGKISNADDFSQFDVIITLQPDSHCISHRYHIVYFQHHIKQYYDLFWQSFRQRKRLKKKMVFLLLTAVARLADRIYLTPNLRKAYVIANSQTVGKRLKKYNRISNFSVINPGCNNKIAAPAPPSLSEDQITTPNNDNNSNSNNDTLQKKNEPNLLLAFSRLNVMQKGIDIILEAASITPHHIFVIAGPYDATVESIDKGSLPPNVQLIVREFSDEAKAELFNKCDVFLAPYIKEDFGITPLEANAYGKPVVYCDDSGEITYTQKHKETGFMCRRNPQAMVEGIEYCMTNKERMKMVCVDNATRYSWQSFEKSFRTYFNNLKKNKT